MARKVTMKSLFGQTELDIGDIGMGLTDGETVLLTDEQAAIALRNPNIVDAATGTNPNYTCGGCGKTTYTTALLERHKIGRDRGPHTSTRVNGQIYCEDCLPRAEAAAEATPREAVATIHAEPVED